MLTTTAIHLYELLNESGSNKMSNEPTSGKNINVESKIEFIQTYLNCKIQKIQFPNTNKSIINSINPAISEIM